MDIMTLAMAKALGGGVKSWNDLEDKPFSEESGEVTLFNGAVRDGDELDTMDLLELDKEYIVVYDGVSYNLVAFDDEGVITIGASYESDFSEYAFSLFNDVDGVALALADDKEHSLHISTMGQVIKPIEEKYMPYSIKSVLNIALVTINIDTQMLSHTPAEIEAMALQGKMVVFSMTGTCFNVLKMNGVPYAVSTVVTVEGDGVVVQNFTFDQYGKFAAMDKYLLSATKQ